MSFSAAIFDLDGTLLDTLEDLALAANRVLAAHGFAIHNIDDYRYFVGDGVETLLTRVLPEAHRDKDTVARCVAEFRQDYRENWNVKTRPYDGVATLLDGIQERGLACAVLSNKPDNFTRLCVDDLLGDWDFEIVRGAMEGVPLKPDPTSAREVASALRVPPAHIVYVGDTATDMMTATAAGMFAVGALWGFRTRRELQDSGACVIIERPADVLDLL